jgi:serine/threonine protein phosphatase 1
VTIPSRTLVIGDVHGCLAQLEALLDHAAPGGPDLVVFLGDLIDRGPDSARVISRVVALRRTSRVVVIMGNHEQMMLEARDSHEKHRDWLLNGGDATLRSYGGVRGTLRDVPPEHWQFLERELVPYVETDSHILVHANCYPDMLMDEQPDYMLRWERCDQIAPHDSGKVIVCGHTPQKSGHPMNRGYAICLDTHASGGAMLTCMELESGRVWQADARGAVVRTHISDFESEP